MRNSNCMAIAPTATISTIIGVSQSIEPVSTSILYVKSNLSGEFTHVNTSLVQRTQGSRSLGYAEMLNDLKYFDGTLTEIPSRSRGHQGSLSDILRSRCQNGSSNVQSRRQKWIDMGQSLNLYMCEPSGRKLHDMYMLAWKKGLKTTYYLRTLAATQIEKSTVDVNRYGLQPRWMKNKSASGFHPGRPRQLGRTTFVADAPAPARLSHSHSIRQFHRPRT